MMSKLLSFRVALPGLGLTMTDRRCQMAMRTFTICVNRGRDLPTMMSRRLPASDLEAPQLPVRPWQTARELMHALRQAHLTANKPKPCAGRRRTDGPHQRWKLTATGLTECAERRRTRGQPNVAVRALNPQQCHEELGSFAALRSPAFEAPNV